MPVYVRGEDRPLLRFHKDVECPQLTKRPARGAPQEVREVEIGDLRFQTPCRFCYPDSPRARSAHRYCTECGKPKTRACAHNGGVPVYMTRTRRKSSILHDAGETYIRVEYVWPERARHFITS